MSELVCPTPLQCSLLPAQRQADPPGENEYWLQDVRHLRVRALGNPRPAALKVCFKCLQKTKVQEVMLPEDSPFPVVGLTHNDSNTNIRSEKRRCRNCMFHRTLQEKSPLAFSEAVKESSTFCKDYKGDLMQHVSVSKTGKAFQRFISGESW